MITTELETLLVRLVGDSTLYMQMLQKAHHSTRAFASAVRYDMQRLQSSVALPLAAIGKTAVQEFAKFDKAIFESAAITDATNAQIEQMRDTALSLSAKAVQGPAELAKGFYNLISTGMDAAQAIEALPVVAKFATAGVMDLGSAIDYLAGSMNALGLDSDDPVKQMQRMTLIGDKLVKLNNRAIGTTKEFAQALTNEAAAAMRQFGISLDDGLAVLGAYAKQQIKGEHAGAVFSRMLRLVTKAAVDHGKEFQKLGIDVFDPVTRELRGPIDIIENMSEVLGKLTTESKVAALSFLGIEARSQNAILPLLGMHELMRDLKDDISAASGEMEKVAQKQLRSFSNQMQLVWNNVTILAIRAGELLAPALLSVGDAVKWLVRQFQSLSTSTQQILVYFGSLTGVIATVSIVAATLVFLFGSMAGGMATLIAEAVALGIVLGYVEEDTQALSGAFSRWGITLESVVDVIRVVNLTLINLTKILASSVIMAVSNTVAWMGEFVQQNRTLFIMLGVVAGAVLIVVGVYKLLAVTIGITIGLLSVLKILQLASLALWAGWSAIVLTAKATLLIFNVQFAIYKALLSVSIGLNTLWAAGAIAAKVATWLWNAALAVMNAILFTSTATLTAFVAGLGALIGTVAILTAAIAGLTYIVIGVVAAVTAAWKVTDTLVDTLLKLPAAVGPIAHISSLFREWSDILKEVFNTVKVDSEIAWKLMAAGFRLAVSQIKDLWPPLWAFISEGFKITMQSIGTLMDAYIVLWTIKTKFAVAEATGILTAAGKKRFEDEIKALEKEVADIQDITLRDIGERLRRAAGKFKVIDSEETKKAREEVEKIADEAVKLRIKIFGPQLPDWVVEAEDMGKKMGHGINLGLKKELEKFRLPDKFDDVLAGSVKDIIMMEEYKKRMFGNRFVPGEILPKNFPPMPKPIAPVIPIGPPLDPNIPIPPLEPIAPPRPDVGPNMPRPGGGRPIQNPFNRPNPLDLEGVFNPLPIDGNKLVFEDAAVHDLLKDILLELKIANKGNRPKIGGGLI